MITAQNELLRELERLDFSGKGEEFVEARFLTPLLRCLGYQEHKDYEVLRHGDDGSSFVLAYPPVENGAKRVKHYKPDYIPTIRKKMFWIIEAKSPRDVPHPFEVKYLVQGLQYCIHPEIQAHYMVVSTRLKVRNGCDFGGERLGKPTNSHCLSQSVAERCRGALGRELPTRPAGPRDRPE